MSHEISKTRIRIPWFPQWWTYSWILVNCIETPSWSRKSLGPVRAEHHWWNLSQWAHETIWWTNHITPKKAWVLQTKIHLSWSPPLWMSLVDIWVESGHIEFAGWTCHCARLWNQWFWVLKTPYWCNWITLVV
jgi:hypothetical protein